MLQTGQVLLRRLPVDFALVLPFKDSHQILGPAISEAAEPRCSTPSGSNCRICLAGLRRRLASNTSPYLVRSYRPTKSAEHGRPPQILSIPIRYRSATNPDFGATFPQAVTITNRTAIPITNADFEDANHIQVIANTAAFHFGFIEQGGSSLYAALSQKVTSLEVLKITLGIGGDEIAHFLEWVDFSGNGVQPPVAPVSDQGLTFPNFFTTPGTPLFQPNLIFPVPCEFISADLPLCSVIRPSDDKFAGAQAAVAALTADGLFLGQTPKFFQVLQQMAEEADAATREF